MVELLHDKKFVDQSSSIDTELEREDRINVASAALDISTECRLLHAET